MADGYVQVPLDSTGKKVDTAELTRPDGTVIERQRIVIGDVSDVNVSMKIGADGSIPTTETSAITQTEMKRQTALLRCIVLQLATLTGITLTEEDLLGD